MCCSREANVKFLLELQLHYDKNSLLTRIVGISRSISLHNTHNMSTTTRHVSQYAEEAMILAKSACGIPLSGLSTGYSQLDRMTGGLQRGHISIISGRWSVCKVALASNIVENIATSSTGNPSSVLVFSTGVAGSRYSFETGCRWADIGLSGSAWNDLDQSDELKLAEAFGKVGKTGVYVDDSVGLTAADLCDRAKALHSRLMEKDGEGLSLVMIDNLQMLPAPRQQTAKETRGTAVMRELKELAEDLNVAVLAVCGMKTKASARDETLLQKDMKWHKATERYAGLIMILDRKHEEEPSANNDTAPIHHELFISKNRNGSIGLVDLSLIRKNKRFVSYSFRN